MFACAGCGAGVPVGQSDRQVRCAFCGTDSPVDPAKLSWHQSLPRAARAAEEEGLDALREALLQRFKPGCGGMMAVASMLFVGGTALVMILTAVAGGGIYIPFVLFGTWIGGSIVAIVRFRSASARAPERAERELSHVHAAVTREPQKGACPECAAKVVVPPLAASITCLFCRSPLVAAEGMLVKWVENAELRRAAWAAQAKGILERVELREKRLEQLSYLIYFSPLLLIFAIAGGVWLLLQVGALSGGRTLRRGETVLVDGVNREIVDIYGKLVRVRAGASTPEWVTVDELTYAYEPEAEPDDANAFSVGDRVVAPWHGIGSWPGTVRDAHGKMIFIRFEDGMTEWVDSAVARPPSVGPGAPSPKSRKTRKTRKAGKRPRKRGAR